MTQARSENSPFVATLPGLRLAARNTSADSENTIHDDVQARRYGYPGGLVPGVTLYAYLTQMAISFYGEAWLERGTADFTARRPVFEGESVLGEGVILPGDGAASRLELTIVREAGPPCAGGIFGLERGDAAAPTAIPLGPPPSDPLPLVRIESGPPLGVPLGPLHSPLSVEQAAAYADLTDDPNPWYRGPSPFGGPLVPPSWLALRQTPLLRANFRFIGPSIHVRSSIRHLAPAFAGRTFITSGIIRENFERKGNRYLVLEAETHDDHGRAVCRVEHTWIWNVREATASAG